MNKRYQLKWIDALKGLAILGILLNHYIETISIGFEFSYPFEKWLNIDFVDHGILTNTKLILWLILQFFAWLGDHGPGVFILVSGITLTFSIYRNSDGQIDPLIFYRKRLIRILPLYFIIHLVVILGYFILPGIGLDWIRENILLSFLGLRFTDKLFFFINPSWWFIWLIIQLYIIFPLLFLFLKRVGIVKFIGITLIFTFLCRLIGLLDFAYSKSLYYWLTGIFFGTRLAEFTIGMAIGYLLWKKNTFELKDLFPQHILFFSIGLLVIGIFSTLYVFGLIFSNLLITIGLVGLLYKLYSGLKKKKFEFIVKPLIWFGLFSFGIYLFHQAPLKWSKEYFSGLHLNVAAFFFLIGSIPLGWLIENRVNLVVKTLPELLRTINLKLIMLVLNTIVVVVLFIFEPLISSHKLRMIFDIFLISYLLLSAYLFFQILYTNKTDVFQIFQYLVLLLIMISVFVFPVRHSDLAVIVFLVVLVFSFIGYKVGLNRFYAMAMGIVVTSLLFVTIEGLLNKFTPLETLRWGEFPALQTNETRRYSLIPDTIIRLKYNNYNYFLQTNTYGLTSPEINIGDSSENIFRILIIGDAFSMPEGIEYKKSYSFLLEEKLQEQYPKRKIQIINGGVTGYGPIEQTVQLEELTGIFHPDLVIYQYFIDEIDQASMDNTDQRLKNIGFDSYPESLPQWIQDYSQINLRYKLFRENIITNLSGTEPTWKYRKSLLKYYETNTNRVYSHEKILKLRFYLDRMAQLCKDNNAGFFIAFVPGQVAVSAVDDILYFPANIKLNSGKFDMNRPFMELKSISDSIGIDLHDLTSDLKKYHDQPVYFPESWHWNENGHKAAAKTLDEIIVSMGYLN